MESDVSDGDDFADLDIAAFSMEASDLSASNVGHGQVNESTHSFEEWDDHKAWLKSHHSALSDDMMQVPQHNQDSFLNSDFDVESYLASNWINNKHSENFDPLINATTLNSDLQEPNSSPAFIDPFSDLFHSYSTRNQFSYTNDSDNNNMINAQVDQCSSVREAVFQHTEYIYLNRLPGENIGMVLGIEGDQENRHTIDTVIVKSVTPGGAVSRSCQGNNKILVGDEVVEINGQRLSELTHDQCIDLLQEMPDNVVLTISRKEKAKNKYDDQSDIQSLTSLAETTSSGVPVPLPRKRSYHANFCNNLNSEYLQQDDPQSNENSLKNDSTYKNPPKHDNSHTYKVPRGFHKLDLTLIREDHSLGLSIVPSYGATCDLYQIKRVLHSGSCAQPGSLKIGDRLLACNGFSLKGLTQAQCLNVLKSSGNLVNLTVLRQIGNNEHEALPEDIYIHLSTSLYAEDEDESFSDLSKTNIVGDPEAIDDEWSYLSNQLEDTLIDVDGVHDPVLHEKVSHSNNTSSYPVNVDKILLLDTYSSEVVKEDEDNAWDQIIHQDKYNESSLNIPPPAQFSDTLVNIESHQNKVDIPVSITNIDDLLFGSIEDSSSISCNNQIYSSQNAYYSSANEDNLLISFDQNTEEDTHRLSLNNAQFTEQLTEECFNNSWFSISKTNTEFKSNYSPNNSSESASDAYEKLAIDSQNQEELFTIRNNLVTIIPVSSTSSSEEHISKIPVSPLNQIENLGFTESVLSPSISTTPLVFTRNIRVNSQPPVNVSHIDVVLNKNVDQDETHQHVNDTKNSYGSVVFHTNGGSYSSSLKPTTIKVDGLHPLEADMSNHLADPVLHTTVGVTCTHQLGEEEEVIKPMTAIRDSQGTPLCIPSGKSTTKHLEEVRILDGDAKQELANVLSIITRMPSTDNRSGKIENEKAVTEHEIIPTLLTNDQREIVVDTLRMWTSMKDNKNKDSIFQKTFSDVIDSHKQLDQHIVPRNALVHTTLGVSNHGDDEHLIQPMIATKDHQGKQLYIPSTQSESSIRNERIFDNEAKMEIANVMSSFSSALFSSRHDTYHPGDPIAEDEIVPTVLSDEHRKIAQNIIQNWINTSTHKRSSSTHYADDDIQISHIHKHTNTSSDYTVESVENEMIKKHTGNNHADVNVNLYNTLKESVQISSVASTGTIPYSTRNTDSVSEESVEDTIQTSDQETLKRKQIAESKISDPSGNDSYLSPASDHVTLRNKSKQPMGFRAKLDHFQQSLDSNSSSASFAVRRPRSMIEASPFATSSRSDDIHKSYANEGKPVPVLRSLSAMRPLSASTASLHSISSATPGRPASGNFSSNTFTSRVSKSDYPKIRQEDGSPFQVDVLKGIAGLGLKVRVTSKGHTVVAEIQRGGPVHKDGQVRVGDCLLFINSTELCGQTDARVQQILRLLPRGLAKLVVTSTTPASLLETQKEYLNNNSYENSSQFLPQPHLPEQHQRNPTLTSVSSPTTLSTDKLYFYPSKDVNSTDQTLPIIGAIKSARSVSQADVSEKDELFLINQEGPDGISAKEAADPAAGSEHDDLYPKATPRHGLTHSVNNNNQVYSDKTKAGESHDIEGLMVDSSEMLSIQTRPAEVVSFDSNSHTNSENNDEILQQYAAVTAVIPLKLKTHPVESGETIPTSSRDQIASPVSSLVSPMSENLNNKVETTQLCEKELSEPKEKLASMKSPPKIPPLVAPKPRLISIPMIKPEDSVDGGETKKSSLRIITGYERLQTQTKVTRPISVGDTTRSFVTSAAKMFDNKGVSSDRTSEKGVTIKRRSMVIHTDDSKIGNNYVLPELEMQKSSHISSPASPSLSPSSSQPRPQTLSYEKVISQETSTQEGSFKSRESPDEKASSNILSTARLNAALSPRRISSVDSPTSSPHNLLTKHAAPIKDESKSKFLNGKSQSFSDYTIYKSTPLVLVTNKSLSHESHKFTPSLHRSQSSHIVTSEHRSKSFTSPGLLPSLSTKEDEFQDAMKKFDDLLTDDSYTHTEADPHDLSLSFPIAQNRLLSSQNADSIQSQIHNVKKPVALPRKKPESKDSDIVFDVSNKKEANLVLDKEELMCVKLEESRGNSFIVVPRLVSASSETNILSGHKDSKDVDDTIRSETHQQTRDSYIISAEHISNKIDQSLETPDKAAIESNLSSDTFEEFNKLLETDFTSSSDASADHEQLKKNEPMNERYLQQRALQGDQMFVAEHTIDQTDGREISERIYHSSFTSNLEAKVNNNEKNEETEANEEQLEILKAQASQIVAAVLSRIQNNPDIFFHEQEAYIDNETTSQELFEDEPPPLPGSPPPLPGSLPPLPGSLPPLPGSLPPLPAFQPTPVYFTDTSLHIQKLVDEKQSTIIPEHATKNLFDQSASSTSVHLDINPHTKSLMLVDFVQDDHPNNREFVQPLTSVGHSIHYNDSMEVTSPNVADILSKSPVKSENKHKEVFTDEVISLPSEKVENVFHDVKKMQFSWDTKTESFPTSSTVQNYESSVIHWEHNAISSTYEESLSRDAMFKVTNKKHSPSSNFITKDDLSPTLSPSFTSPSVTVCHTSTSHTDDFLTQLSSPYTPALPSQPLSPTVNLLDIDIPSNDNKEFVQEVSSSEKTSKSRFELSEKHLQYPYSDIASDSSHNDISVSNQALLQTTDTPTVTVMSKRKWCLRSNKSRLPVLSGESHVPVHVDYSDMILARSQMRAGDLKSFIDTANTVLDAASAADSLVLLVVHLHQDGRNTPLNIDLQHKGGIWFQVSNVRNGSSLWKECGVESGDWLVSVDDLWCDQVTLMMFKSKLEQWQHDLLLVFARGEKPVNIAETKPVPSPRPRSTNKHGADEQILKILQYDDFVNTAAELSPVKEPLTSLVRDSPDANERHKLSSPKQENEFQPNLLEHTYPELLIPSDVSPQRHQVPSLSNHALPVPDQAPPLPKNSPPLPEKSPSLLDKSPPLPDKLPPLLLLDKSPPLPDHQAQLLGQTSPLPVHMSIFPDAVIKKEATKLHQENVQVSQPSYEDNTISVKSKPISNREQSDTIAGYHINKTALINSSAPVKYLPSSSTPEKQHSPAEISKSLGSSPGQLGPGIHKVVMMKGATGVGFCLEGGLNSPKGDMPVIIKRIFKGGPAEKCGMLKVMDEILEVNGVKFDSMRHYEAWNHLKFLDDGEVHMTIRRP